MKTTYTNVLLQHGNDHPGSCREDQRCGHEHPTAKSAEVCRQGLKKGFTTWRRITANTYRKGPATECITVWFPVATTRTPDEG